MDDAAIPYRDIRCMRPPTDASLLAVEVQKRLADDTLTFARRGIDAFVGKHTLNDEVDPHRPLEFLRAREARPTALGEELVELVQQLALVGAEPDTRRRRAVALGWHTGACKAAGITPATGREAAA